MLDPKTITWNPLIKEEKEKPYFKELVCRIREDAKTHIIYPPHTEVFNAFKYCIPNNTKIVVLGMDPYHGPNQAHGLAFSVQPGILIPPSLLNIFKEIQSDMELPIPLTGCLTPWAQQGVLLLNTVLTVRQGQAGSHKDIGWEIFTDKIISYLDGNQHPIVFLLWGAFARSKKKLLNNPDHLVLETSHPSPLSVYSGFRGCKHFSQANQFLIDNDVEPIDWSLK